MQNDSFLFKSGYVLMCFSVWLLALCALPLNAYTNPTVDSYLDQMTSSDTGVRYRAAADLGYLDLGPVDVSELIGELKQRFILEQDKSIRSTGLVALMSVLDSFPDEAVIVFFNNQIEQEADLSVKAIVLSHLIKSSYLIKHPKIYQSLIQQYDSVQNEADLEVLFIIALGKSISRNNTTDYQQAYDIFMKALAVQNDRKIRLTAANQLLGMQWADKNKTKRALAQYQSDKDPEFRQIINKLLRH